MATNLDCGWTSTGRLGTVLGCPHITLCALRTMLWPGETILYRGETILYRGRAV
ncbi:hypothetical protein [Parapedobacter sp.]